MKRKIIFLLFTMFGLSCAFHASELNHSAISSLAEEITVEKPTHFILCLKDGSTAAFLLAHNPMVTNGKGYITVIDEDYIIDYPLSNVDRYMMGVDDVLTSVENIENTMNGIFEQCHGMIKLSGFKPGLKIKVTNINGICVQSTVIGNDGTSEINISTYVSGIYIFNINNQTFKITKR